MAKPPDTEPTIAVDMEELLALQAEAPLQLQQVSGLGEGRIFRVLPLQEAHIGRDDSCEICLEEKIISRRHTKINYSKRYPEVVDLGSSNGTYLNGKPVDRAYLCDGDNLQVGTCSFQVQLGQETRPDEDFHLPPEEMQRISRALDSSQGELLKVIRHKSVFSGQLREINLMSLLQTLSNNKSTGSLSIQFKSHRGSVHLDRGELFHARLGRVVGPKALYRMVRLTEGRFEFFAPGREPEERTFDGGLEKHLLEAARHLDEMEIYLKQLPEMSVHLSFKPKLVVDLKQVPPPVLEVMAAVSKAEILEDVLEICPMPDLDISRILVMLLKRGLLQQRSTVGTDTSEMTMMKQKRKLTETQRDTDASV